MNGEVHVVSTLAIKKEIEWRKRTHRVDKEKLLPEAKGRRLSE